MAEKITAKAKARVLSAQGSVSGAALSAEDLISGAALSAEDLDINSPDFRAEELSYFQYIEAQGRKDVDPLSKEGVELQAAYVKSLSQHPVDVMTRIMTNIFCTPTERMNAAKTLMEYSMRKVPSNIDVTTDSGALKIHASALVGLTMEELDLLEKILAKANENIVLPLDTPL